MINSIITGSGSYVPENEIENISFIEHNFCSEDGRRIQNNNTEVIQKFQEITGISARRYISDNQSSSDIASIAAKRAIKSSGVNPEELDCIIVAHNFGDLVSNSNQTDIVPSIANRVKHNLGIKNPFCVASDLIFGCPGWIQALIQAHLFIKSGENKKCLIVGTEVLSRILDPFDRDTMIFADGAGAVVLEAKDSDSLGGIIAHASMSHSEEEVNYLKLDKSFNKFATDNSLYVKMQGRKIYEYALNKVPEAMMYCLDKSGVDITDIKKILIHQANEKMDEAIVKRFYRKYGIKKVPENIMPMIIERLGNSSVATVPTLYDLIMKNELEGHEINLGDHILFASVGAGMNINCVVYKA